MESRRGYHLLIVASALMWGSSFPLIKVTLDYVNPYFLTAVRMLIAGAIGLVFVMAFSRTAIFKEKTIWVLAGLNALGYGLQHVGMQYALASESSLLINVNVIFVAILAAYGLLFPERTILFMLLFPIKAKYFVLLIAAIELYLIWVPSGVSHFAHLSGMLIGYLYLKKEWNFSRLVEAYYNRKRRRKIRLVEKENLAERQEQEEVDRILDKISAQGMKSLSSKELKTLERASERKRDK